MNRRLLLVIAMLIFCVSILFSCKNKSVDKQTKLDNNINNRQENTSDAFIQQDIAKDDIDNEDSSKEDSNELVNIHDGQAINPLTGLWIDEELVKRRPVAVMVNNIKAAMPQSGLAGADIIYEAPVEGGINRLMAVFQDYNIDKIGPVRSARRYFIDFAFDNDAIYIHHGKDPMLYTVFQNINSPHMDAQIWEGILNWRDNSRIAPHNSYVNNETINKVWDKLGYRKATSKEVLPLFNFNETETELGTTNAEHVIIQYSIGQKSEFVYDKIAKCYKRFQFDEKQIDANINQQLTTKNIIIQYAHVYNRPGDTAGRLDIDLISTGKGYYISDGKVININWNKKDQYMPTEWLLENGEKLKINKGKTWICIVPLNIKIGYN